MDHDQREEFQLIKRILRLQLGLLPRNEPSLSWNVPGKARPIEQTV